MLPRGEVAFASFEDVHSTQQPQWHADCLGPAHRHALLTGSGPIGVPVRLQHCVPIKSLIIWSSALNGFHDTETHLQQHADKTILKYRICLNFFFIIFIIFIFVTVVVRVTCRTYVLSDRQPAISQVVQQTQIGMQATGRVVRMRGCADLCSFSNISSSISHILCRGQQISVQRDPYTSLRTLAQPL